MVSDPWFLLAACLAVILIGFAKGGFSGLGALATPVLALVTSPVQAAAILLPLLIASDVVSVWSFRRSWNRRIVAIMLPGALLGIALGWLIAARFPVAAIMAALGILSVGFGVWRLWVERGGRIPVPKRASPAVGAACGVAIGFASQIAHSGAPPFQIWVAPQRLPHTEYVGTSAVLFAIINWAKVPGYIALGEFDASNLTLSAMLAPLAIAATLTGIWLVRRVHSARFYTIVYLLMIGLGGKLLIDAF